MASRTLLIKRAADFAAELNQGLSAGHFIKPLDENLIGVGFRQTPAIIRKEIKLPVEWGVVVGLDIREWTKRSAPGQLVVAAIMNGQILQTRDLLRAHGLFSHDDPLLIVPTGDGAYIVFDAGGEVETLEPAENQVKAAREKEKAERKAGTEAPSDEVKREKQEATAALVKASAEAEKAAWKRVTAIGKALCFVLTLNAFFSEQNSRGVSSAWSSRKSQDMPVLPIYPRFALTIDRMLLCIDKTNGNDRLNAIGPAMVTCGRLLSSDHGNHFLVHDRLLHECAPYGGLARVASRLGGMGSDWDAHFHYTELPETKIKSGQFRYADVFGHYGDAPLLRLHGRESASPLEYHIGSHDVLRLT